MIGIVRIERRKRKKLVTTSPHAFFAGIKFCDSVVFEPICCCITIGLSVTVLYSRGIPGITRKELEAYTGWYNNIFLENKLFILLIVFIRSTDIFKDT